MSLDLGLIRDFAAHYNEKDGDVDGVGFAVNDLIDLQMHLHWLQNALKTLLEVPVSPKQETDISTGEKISRQSSPEGDARNVRARTGDAQNIASDPEQSVSNDLPAPEQSVAVPGHTSLSSKFEEQSTLRSYAEVAEKLIQRGFYNGQFDAIAEFATRIWLGGFVVLDLPSGEGKTLFGVALYLLDKDHEPRQNLPPVLAKVHKNWKIVNCIWPNAVAAQPIYEEIICYQRNKNITTSIIFDRAKLLIPSRYDSTVDLRSAEKYVWFTVLQHVFHDPGFGSLDAFDLQAFRRSHGLEDCELVLFLDEIPIEVEDVLVITKLRDACQILQNVIVILSGTNSKAANMLGMAEASTKVSGYAPWAVLITRTPTFQLELSSLNEVWISTKTRVAADFGNTDLTFAVHAIESSIRTHGNSRLISIAISTLNRLVRSKGTRKNFRQFRMDFSVAVFNSKFLVSRSSFVFAGLVGQLNLMCGASTVAEFADAVIGSHFGRRVVPDMGSAAGTFINSAMNDCAGHLCIAENTDRCLGNVMHYVKGRGASMMDSETRVRSWQTSVFSSFDQDMLLYLAACREKGFFHVLGGACSHQFKTYEVCFSAWKWNAAGLINFQNTSASINPGSLLEIIATASICNAAALKMGTGFSEFMVQFAQEIGVTWKNGLEQFVQETTCEELRGIVIPACVFPGKVLPLPMGNTIGIVKRDENPAQFNVELILPSGQTIRFVVKDRKYFSNRNVWNAASKLFATNEQIGVLVVQGCCNYWGLADSGNDQPCVNRSRIATFFKNKKTKFVKRIYLVRSDGEVSVVNPQDSQISIQKAQFLFVFQVKHGC